jgi:ABC-type dipeptide/oligopeptide/nickel transport system permease component
MMTGIIKKAIYMVFVLWGISLGTFALFSLAPGDPAEIILQSRHEAPNPSQIKALRQELGLDDPWAVRYIAWTSNILKGNLGRSWQTGRPVFDTIAEKIPATLELAGAAFVLVILISSACGGCAALFRNRLLDHLIQVTTVVVTAMPAFWLGILLMYSFSLKFQMFPTTGRGTTAHLVLPALTLAMGVAMLQANVLRATLVRIMTMDHIRFAVAKGLGAKMIFFRHMLPAALVPMVTLWGISLGQLSGGAMIVESVFAWPGIGRLTVEAVLARDIPTAQALILMLSFIFVVINTLVDLAHLKLDPLVGQTP